MAADVLDAALEYARNGVPVVPWSSDKKRGSLLPGGKWKARATTDEATIRSWARLWKRDDALIATVLGERDAVLDTDRPELMNGVHALPDDAPTRVGGRGAHYWLQGPARYATSLTNDAGAVFGELLGAGHVAVLPTPGTKYSWADDRRPWDDRPPVPEWAMSGASKPEAAGDWAPPTAEDPITTRDELLQYVGRYAGLDESLILGQLKAMLGDGRIESTDDSRPWDLRRDLAPIAREFSRKPRPMLPPAELFIKHVRSGGDGMITPGPIAVPGDWPELAPAALTGVAGELWDLVEPTTEGDPVSVLAALLTWFGAAVGNGPHTLVGTGRHHANLYAVTVGDTSKARKGLSGDVIRGVLSPLDPLRTVSASTGEGLIFQVRDARKEFDPKTKKFAVKDGGVEDKRLLVQESEFGRLLRVAQRQASTLTSVLRQAWDGDRLSVAVKGDMGGYSATGAHVGLLGNITREELLALLTRTDQDNGFANRILWLAVRRRRLLALPPPIDGDGLVALRSDLNRRLDAATRRGEVTLSDAAARLWVERYPVLSVSIGGAAGRLTDRSEAQARRLALVYTLLEGSRRTEPRHIEAALAVVDYAMATAGLLMGHRMGRDEDRVLEALRLTGGRMPRSRVRSEVLHDRPDRIELDALRDRLVAAGRMTTDTERTRGRPVEAWVLAAVPGKPRGPR